MGDNVTLGGSIRPARLVVEVLAIVASILLAFGIDAWWEERQEAGGPNSTARAR